MREGTTPHLHVLGIVEIVYAVVHVVGFLVLALMGLVGCGGCFAADTAREAIGLASSSLAVSGGAVLFALLFAFVGVAGLALMNGRAWAKIATIVFAVLSIANFPLGTAFAVYAIWAIVKDHHTGRL